MSQHIVTPSSPSTQVARRAAKRALREAIAEITANERAKREHSWAVRRAAAWAYFGRERIRAGRWATAFQATFGKLANQGKDYTAIPGHDTLPGSIADDFPEFTADGGTERLWDLLLSPHDPMPKPRCIRRAALDYLDGNGHAVPPEEPKPPKPAPKQSTPKPPAGEALPECFDDLVALAKARRNILLVGPAGCGKTYIARVLADHLGLRFGSVNCTSGMGESHLVGRGIPNFTTGKNEFQSTEFLDCYENGGVFLLDEMDAADSNVLLALNTALSNGHCNVPARADRPRAERHPDFVLVATANTYGRGADRVYAGRNQLDEATLDRFRIGTIEMTYADVVDRKVCPAAEIRNELQRIRRQVEDAGLRRLVSSRFIEDAYAMHDSAGWAMSKILDRLLAGWTPEEREKARV